MTSCLGNKGVIPYQCRYCIDRKLDACTLSRAGFCCLRQNNVLFERIFMFMDNKGKIYTRKGDKGQTSLFGNTRVSKTDKRVDTYGTVDELNSTIGHAIAHLKEIKKGKKKIQKVTDELEHIQHDLLNIGSTLANPENPKLPQLAQRVIDFEKLIDLMTEALPPLHNFIHPGGGLSGSQLHFCRTTCRRTERRIVSLSQDEDIDDNIRMYFNRLSDLLFTMARYVNHIEKQKETIWNKENR